MVTVYQSTSLKKIKNFSDTVEVTSNVAINPTLLIQTVPVPNTVIMREDAVTLLWLPVSFHDTG